MWKFYMRLSNMILKGKCYLWRHESLVICHYIIHCCFSPFIACSYEVNPPFSPLDLDTCPRATSDEHVLTTDVQGI